MKILRWLGKTFGSIIFTSFLVLAIFLMGLVEFSSYENAQSVAGPIIKQQILSAITQEQLDILHLALLQQCSTADNVVLPLGDVNATLDCNDVRNSNASQLPDIAASVVIENFYYKDYSCSFFDCLKSSDQLDKLVVVSNEGNQFYKTWRMHSWITSGFGLIILLISTETWIGRLRGVGLNLVFTGLPFLLLQFIQPFLILQISPEIQTLTNPIIDNLFSSITTKFIIVLAIGIVLVVLSFVLGLLSPKKPKKN